MRDRCKLILCGIIVVVFLLLLPNIYKTVDELSKPKLPDFPEQTSN